MKYRILFLASCLFAACSSPQNALENQDYDKAFKLALAGLNKGKDEKANRTILQQSLERIIEQQAAVRQRLSGSDSPESWKEGLNLAYGLQSKVKEARAFLPGAFEREAQALPQQARWFRTRLYNHYFQEGQDNLARSDSTGRKAYAQWAYGDFSKAREYDEAPSARLDSLIRTAYNKGIVYYQVDIDAPFNPHTWEINRIFSELEDMSGGFLRVSVDKPFKNPDCAIEIRLGPIEIDIDEELGEEDFNKEVILEYKTVTDSVGNESKVPVYGTAEGAVTTIIKTKTVAWEADVNIEARTPDCELSGGNFEASTAATIREIHVSGDERAIPEKYLNAPAEEFIEEDDMAEQVLRDLYEQVIRAYF
ncbi:MAG: hypothetical protein KDD10_23415 [Phaeodactylibacter sp.]|nr:hypothetical protein [Phaeodactylibacter sp.]